MDSTDNDLPLWVQPVELEMWPTQLLESNLLHCHLSVPEWWQAENEVRQNSLESSQTLRGGGFSEFLELHYLATADPEAKLTNWVDTLVAITELPAESAALDKSLSPKLLEWDYLGEFAPLKARWEVDEVHLYQGLMIYHSDKSELARLYIVVCRRANSAWKIVLSFSSACPPGMPQAAIDSNDHVRAAATFGHLYLDS